MPPLAVHLEALYRQTDAQARLASDPVAFPHRYRHRQDVEVAAVLAASLAYGRVRAFWPVLEQIFALAHASGGPAAWAQHLDRRSSASLLPLVYRWNRGIDLVLLVAALGRALGERGTLEHLFAPEPGETDTGPGLTRGVEHLRSLAVELAPDHGLRATAFEQLPRGFRTLLPRPSDGSACKRWCMFLRWMVRPTLEGVDLGLWTSISPSSLVIPLDTHVLRIARFVGLTDRRDGSWRTALAITRALRALDPSDPTRYDFSLAHLGISGACRGHRHPDACPGCALDPVCTAPQVST